MTKHVLNNVAAIDVYFGPENVNVGVYFIYGFGNKNRVYDETCSFMDQVKPSTEIYTSYPLSTAYRNNRFYYVILTVKPGVHVEKTPALTILEFLIENFVGLPEFVSVSQYSMSHLANNNGNFISLPFSMLDEFKHPVGYFLDLAQKQNQEINKWINMLTSNSVTISMTWNTLMWVEWTAVCKDWNQANELKGFLIELAKKANKSELLTFRFNGIRLLIETKPGLMLHDLLAHNDIDPAITPDIHDTEVSGEPARDSYAIMQQTLTQSIVPSADPVPFVVAARPEEETSDAEQTLEEDSYDEEIIFSPFLT